MLDISSVRLLQECSSRRWTSRCHSSARSQDWEHHEVIQASQRPWQTCHSMGRRPLRWSPPSTSWKHEALCSPLQSPLAPGMISPIETFRNQRPASPNRSCWLDTMLPSLQRTECSRWPPIDQMRWSWLQDSWVDERWMTGPCEVVLGESIVLPGSPCSACPMVQMDWGKLEFVLLGGHQVVNLLWWLRSRSWTQSHGSRRWCRLQS